MRTLIVTAALLLGFASSVAAHSPVSQSEPADGAVLQTVPQALTLTLSDPGRFMRVEVTHTPEGGAAGDPVDLDIPSREVTEMMEFSAPDMGAGTYVVEWRVLGDDGHALTGTVTYTVQAE